MKIGKPLKIVRVKEPAIPYRGEPITTPERTPATVPAQ